MRTRFAPSPTGHLHLGHAASAWLAWEKAGRSADNFILRIEDIDPTRCKPEFTTGIFEDLSWLGLDWQKPVLIQSEHFPRYQAVLNTLEERNLLYPCFCTRKEIQEEIARAPAAPHGPEGALYPGTCRTLSPAERQDRMVAGEQYALRLDMAAALREVSAPLTWYDEIAGEQIAPPETLGDVVLARKDTPASYHLCVTIDDAFQDIDLIVRGTDLFHATHIHRLLQHLLDYPTPRYHHHPLATDETGRRYAKRDNSVTLQCLRESGCSPDKIRRLSGAA